MKLATLTARELRLHPGRALLTLLSIAIATGAIVAVASATDSTHRALDEMYESVSGRSALEVVARDGSPFDASVLPLVAGTEGVRNVVPVLQSATVVYLNDLRLRSTVLGIDPARDRALRDYTIRNGRFLEPDDRGALLEAAFAQQIGVGVGDKLRLLTYRGRKTVPVLGLLEPNGLASLNQGTLIFMPLALAQDLFKRDGLVSVASLILTNSADEETVRRTIAAKLPEALTVRRPASRTQLARETLLSVEQGMTFATALILVLAVFMIMNTFLMNVNQRRAQLAILRAIGATRGQIVRLMLVEGFALGMLGTAIGIPLGLGGAHFLLRAMAAVYATPLPPVRFAILPVVAAAVLGPALALLATYFPARVAGAVAPWEGLRPVESANRKAIPLGYLVLGGGLYGLNICILCACLYGWMPIRFILPCGVVLMGGTILLILALFDPLTRYAALIFSPLLRQEMWIAQRQLMRRRARSTLTIGVLYMAIGTTIGLGTAIINNVHDITSWYDQTMVGDFFIRAPFSDPVSGLSPHMPQSLAEQFRQIQGVEDVSSLRFQDAEVAGQPVVIAAGGFSKASRVPIELTSGDSETVFQQLKQGEVVIGTNLAQRAGLKDGDQITLDSAQGPLKFRIAATTVSYTVGGLIVYIDRLVAEKLLGMTGVDMFIINADSKRLSGTESALRTKCNEEGLRMNSFAVMRRALDATIAGVVTGLWALIVLTFVVSSFGITNTLTMNVLEQTRDIALLRIVGMTRHQVRKTIFSQAIILGFISLITGVLVGIVTAHNISLCNLTLLGHPVPFSLSRPLLIGCSLAALGIVVLAAWPPAERAARLPLPIALRYD